MYQEIIEGHNEDIRKLCRQHNVVSLAVFGSILTDRFNDKSDIDMLVVFRKGMPHYVANYHSLVDKLEALLKRTVDLVEYDAIRNLLFKHSVDQKKKMIYGG